MKPTSILFTLLATVACAAPSLAQAVAPTPSTKPADISGILAQRISQIQEELAINPPPLTVDFKGATLDEVAAALSLATGHIIQVRNSDLIRGTPLFSLTAHARPFWQIVRDLSRQHPLDLMPLSENQLYFHTDPDISIRNIIIDGPLVIAPQNILGHREADLQEEFPYQLKPEFMTFRCFFAVDPRINIISYSKPVFTQITDDLGNDLLLENPPDKLTSNSGIAYFETYQFPLKIPEKKGSLIRSAKGHIRFLAAVTQDQLDLSNDSLKPGTTFQLVGHTFKIDTFSATPRPSGDGWLTVKLAISQLPSTTPDPGSIRTSLAVTLTTDDLILLNQTIIPTQNPEQHTPPLIAEGLFPPTFKLHLSAPTKTKEVTIPFELRDLPLP